MDCEELWSCQMRWLESRKFISGPPIPSVNESFCARTMWFLVRCLCSVIGAEVLWCLQYCIFYLRCHWLLDIFSVSVCLIFKRVFEKSVHTMHLDHTHLPLLLPGILLLPYHSQLRMKNQLTPVYAARTLTGVQSSAKARLAYQGQHP